MFGRVDEGADGATASRYAQRPELAFVPGYYSNVPEDNFQRSMCD